MKEVESLKTQLAETSKKNDRMATDTTAYELQIAELKEQVRIRYCKTLYKHGTTSSSLEHVGFKEGFKCNMDIGVCV